MSPWGELSEGLPEDRVEPGELCYDVVAIGASVANLFLLLELSSQGCRAALLCPEEPPQSASDFGVLWPGLTEHWGLLRPHLGRQVEGFLGLFAASREHLRQNGPTQAGAVLQCACNPTEMDELSCELRWLNALWPRRLMGAAASTNYLPLLKSEGAAFVPDSLSLDPRRYRRQLLQELVRRGVAIGPLRRPYRLNPGSGVELQLPGGQSIRAELGVVGCSLGSTELLELSRRWLLPMQGLGMTFPQAAEPWNRALVGVESHRGHLMLAPRSQGGWMSLAVAPSIEEDDVRLRNWVLRELEEWVGLSAPASNWDVTFAVSADGLPLVGPLPGHSRLWMCCGMGSRSWSWGPGLGVELARVLLGQESCLLQSLPALRPSRWLSG